MQKQIYITEEDQMHLQKILEDSGETSVSSCIRRLITEEYLMITAEQPKRLYQGGGEKQ